MHCPSLWTIAKRSLQLASGLVAGASPQLFAKTTMAAASQGAGQALPVLDRFPVGELASLMSTKQVLFLGTMPVAGFAAVLGTVLLIRAIRYTYSWNDMGLAMRANDQDR